MLQTYHQRLSLYDIQEKFGASRRTAERTPNAVARSFATQIERFDTPDKIRRWKLKSSIKLVSFTPEEPAKLEKPFKTVLEFDKSVAEV
ncbi:MAG TPA: hypothetical protein P5556_01400 [Candidatus Gastranaerophilales bacterium]|nr:hypothetical protein [Candidatus Gastranaerophilales bacterium]